MAYITLKRNNFFNNLDIIAKHTKSVDKIALVLKDNAYGHGLHEIALMAQQYGVSKVVVRTDAEAQLLKDMFAYILVLADTPKKPSETIRYTINDIQSIASFAKGSRVELKVDTGMHRNGISMSKLQGAFAAIDKAGLHLEAVFTHHRSADELSSEWFWQNENFKQIKERSKELSKKFGFSELRFHSANSAALFRTHNFSEDMARVGIGAYGCLELPKALGVQGLQPVLSLYAQKISSRTLHKGECVGYGATFESVKKMQVSNYDFGYADGFLRICSNNYVTPEGKELIGRISMDNSSFVSEDEELLIFDDAREVAKSAATISYEVLTALKPHLQRVVV